MKKHLLLLFICFLSATTIFAQEIPQRGVIVKSPPPPFQPNTQQLQLFLDNFEDLLTCRETFDTKEVCFFSETELADYINYLMEQKYPTVRQETKPLFVNMINEAKAYLKNLLENSVSHIELHGTKQRYGTTEAMKVVIPYINIYYHDGQAKTIRLSLMEHENAYKIMGIDR